jgi:hypothetical protein
VTLAIANIFTWGKQGEGWGKRRSQPTQQQPTTNKHKEGWEQMKGEQQTWLVDMPNRAAWLGNGKQWGENIGVKA